MALVTRFINTASSGGDGTTNGTSGATAAYASMSAWSAGEETDLVADGDNHVVRTDGGQDGTKVNLSTAWNTDATHDVVIRANTGNEATPLFSTSKYRLEGSFSYDSCIENVSMAIAYLTLFQLQIHNTGTALLADGLELSGGTAASDLVVDRCYIKKTGSSGSSIGIDISSPTSGTTVRKRTVVNCVVEGPFVTSIVFNTPNASGTTNIIYANTVVDSGGTGISSTSNGTASAFVKNNAVDNSVTADFNNTASYDETGGNCSSDATSPESGLRTRTFTFENAAGDDYHWASGDVGAAGNGLDLSSDSNLAFSIDMEGQTRVAWDSGADEKTVAGGRIMSSLVRSGGLAGSGGIAGEGGGLAG